MTLETGSLIFILVGFAIAFGIARFVGARRRSRQTQADERTRHAAESRQARRARERKERR